MISSEQQSALVAWKGLLAEAGLDRVLIRHPECEPPQVAPRFRVVTRLFGDGQEVSLGEFRTCVPDDLLAGLEALGLVNRIEDRVATPYRLAFHMGLGLFYEKASPSARFYYGNDSTELSRMLVGATGNVLDLCSGVGPQALVCARTATRVTAVEIEPQAAKLFWINAAMNGLADKVEILIGDLLDPVAGRRFDLISCNPPFMPVPPGVRYPVFAGGGGDGLDFFRRLLPGLAEALTPDGRCEAVGALLGNHEGPNLAPFKKMAADSCLALIVDCRTREDLEGETLKQLVGIALQDQSEEDIERAFRSHFAHLNATHLYCFLLHAMPSPSPMLCASYFDGERTAFRMASFP
jgi:methylase of polypeptide subunit release factors